MKNNLNYSLSCKRILYVITTGILGGAQVHLYDLISCLPAETDVHVVMGEKGWLWGKLQDKKITLHHLPRLVQPVSAINDFKTSSDLRHLITRVRPDLVHCHCSKAGFLGRFAANSCGIPSVFTAHGWSFTEGISKFKKIVYRLLERLAANWGSRIICVSEYDRQLGLLARPGSWHKMVTIHNGVRDITKPTINPELRHNDPPDLVKLIMIARFNPQKDQMLLLHALAALLKENLRLSVTFVGEGPNIDAAVQLAKQLAIDDKVIFLGNRDDIPQLLEQHDIFVLTSNWEGLPLSILEAMRQGLPVVASDVGGVKEAVADKATGFLVPRGDLLLLTRRLRELCQDYELCRQFGQEGNKVYQRSFALEVMTKKTLAIYDEILASEAGAKI